jgi:branched-chain amino acid transport system substrate-binding protein
MPRLLPLLLLSLLLPGPAGAAKRKNAEDPAIIRQAQTLALESRVDALELLEGYLAEGEDRDLIALVTLHAGEQWRLSSDPVTAREYFDRVRTQHADNEAAEAASLGLALLDYSENASGNTLATLEFLSPRAAPATMQADRYRVLALDASAKGAAEREVQSLARKALAYAAADPGVEARVYRSLEGLLPESEAPESQQVDLPMEAGADALALDRAREALQQGDTSRAKKLATALKDTYPDSPFVTGADWVIRMADAGNPLSPNKVGVLLPLSGQFALPGSQIKDALNYANRGSGVELVFRDTGGKPEEAVKQFEGLVLDHGVVAVIGPLLKDDAMAVAPEAQAAGVPLITLTQTPGITAAGDYVFRGLVTPENQIEGLLDFAMGNLGLRIFAVMAPSTPFGSSARDAFVEGVRDRGGQMSQVVMYDPDKTSFASEATQLKAQDYDAIFIPDNHRTVTLVAASLAYSELAIGGFSPGFERDPVPLLGLNGWHNQMLADQGGKYVENCYFVDVFDGEDGTPEMRSFAASYEAAVGRSPGVIEALAYDAGQLVFAAAQEGPDTREAFRKALNDAAIRSPVTGGERLDDKRELDREMMIYVIETVTDEVEGAEHINTKNVMRRID